REILKNGKAGFEIQITPDMSPATTVRVYKIEKDLDVVRDSLVLLVSSPEQLDVNITTDKDIYRPNEELRLYFHVSNATSHVLSAIGISAVDLSVFEVSQRFSGFEDVFWGLEEEFLTPQYQIISYVFDPMPSPLPVEGDDEVPKGGDMDEIGILSSWPKVQEDAKNVKNEWVDNYWGAIALLAILGFFGLFALAIKYKAAAVVSIFIMMLLLLTMAAVLYSSVSPMMAPSGSPGVPPGEKGAEQMDEGGGDDVWFVNDNWEDDGIWEFDMAPLADKGSNRTLYGGTGPSHVPTHVRTYFPETWYWNPALITDQDGYAFVTLTTPDSITSWGIDAIASTKDAQIGTGNTEVTVFQEFFVEPDIPVSVIRGDEFPLRVLVYNYENTVSNITVELQDDPWFELLSGKVKSVEVEANGVSSVDFFIKANTVGEHNVTINASSISLEDKIVKKMRIDPDGKRIDNVANGQLDNDQSVSVDIGLDPQRVKNSENAYVKLQGGMEAVTLDGAETFIRFVSGCGEQSMSTLSIDILAFDTVQKMGGTDEQLFEFETITNQGIQHELTFLLEPENKIGRGIVWFPSDRDVHPWLTSWGLITFQDAKNAGFNLDDAIITDMQDWLVSQQNHDGSYQFPDWGIYETNNPILKAKKVATTAYITRALLYSGFSESHNAITKSLGYIGSHISEHWDDPYTLSLSLIALEDADGDATLRNDIASRLENLKEEENSTVFWTSDNNMISDGDDMWGLRYSSSPRIIEATGYAIMALTKHGGYADTVNKAVNYLLAHRNGLGGFFSTQDTVVAFQALAAIGEIHIEEITVTVEAGGAKIESTVFTDKNKDLTYLIDLRPYLDGSTTVTITTEGDGSILYQVYWSQYIPWDIIGPNEPQKMSLNVNYSTTNITVNDQIEATLRLEYLGEAAKLKMVLVDLRAPVGFSFVEDDLKNLVAIDKISNYEINDREVMVYIQDIYPNQPVLFTYHLLANKPVKGVVQGIHAFDMYNPDLDVELEPIEIVSTL
ncbi:MAG: alpha-2-macroglobulin family protein, partial [Thermoplasmata archaeon]